MSFEKSPVQRMLEREIRQEERVKIKVTCAVVHCVLPGGHLVTEGENDVICYASDLPKIEALVEPDMTEVRAAEKRYSEMRSRAQPGKYKGPPSAAAEFFRVNGRGILPLRKVEILDTLPPPEPVEQAQTKALVAEILRGVLTMQQPQRDKRNG